jgi:predicted metal-binding membrane protein
VAALCVYATPINRPGRYTTLADVTAAGAGVFRYLALAEVCLDLCTLPLKVRLPAGARCHVRMLWDALPRPAVAGWASATTAKQLG